MLRYFRRIEVRAQELGNHRRKYLYAIEKWGRVLVDRLETAGILDRVHLRQAAYDVGAEMDCVLDAAHDEREKLSLLGCYYSLQFLLMNLRSIDLLRLNVTDSRDRVAVYRVFLQGAGEEFVRLVGDYMNRLLRLFLAGVESPEFAVCTVGTRLHQDDVDLGIIDDGSPARVNLNRAIGKMGREMLRWTSVPDFYLSQHVGSAGYSASIDEYRERLDRRILDFVSVSEILSAYPIIGSRSLFEHFRSEIHNRYYYRRGGATREHEGYLRGLLGEMLSLLRWPRDRDRIYPKRDLLQLVICVNCSFRAIYRIRELDTWTSLRSISRVLPDKRKLFDELERAYTFVETFRHLYQQFVTQEEEIDLTDPGEQEGLQQVAEAMGYEDIGVIRAWQHLIVDYFEYTKTGHEVAHALEPDLRAHIRSITGFAPWTRSPRAVENHEGGSNLAVEFMRGVRYFEGTKYWDDILDAIEAEDQVLLKRLVLAIEELPKQERIEVLRLFARWGHGTFYSMMRLLTTLADFRTMPAARKICHALNAFFLARCKGTPEEIQRVSTVFVHSPLLVHRYLTMLDDEKQYYFHKGISGTVWDAEVGAWRDRLVLLSKVHLNSSRYFRRTVERACEHHPEVLLHFGDLPRLSQIAQGLLADAMRLPSPEEQKAKLGQYYDVEFLRIGLASLQGVPLGRIDAESTEFLDHFLESLFDICKAEVDQEQGRRILTHDLLALFVAGGHGRERAHQDDWDLIVLLNSDSDTIFAYANRIISRLNREITRRGIMPQYHFADRFGSYVTRFSELRDFLRDSSCEEAFVEACQLVGARMIVGSSRLEHEVQHEIIEGMIFRNKDEYSQQVVDEIVSRRSYADENDGPGACDIKECRGGLRDLELAMLLLKVLYEIRDPIGGQFWDILAEQIPAHERHFLELKESYQFLNHLRDIYRLSVSPVNVIEKDQLERPALLMSYRGDETVKAGARLANDYQRHRQRVAAVLDQLIEQLG